MKNRLACLFLALVMTLSCFVFAACSSKTEEEALEGSEQDSTKLTTATLTLWIPTDKSTTEEALLAVQDAINKITKAKFETAIELHAIPSAQYETARDAKLTEIEEQIAFEEAEAARKREEAKLAAQQGITTEETTEETTVPEDDEIFVNDAVDLEYPPVEDTQMDIVLIRGYEDYMALIERKALVTLDSELSGSSKLLKQYVYPSFLTYAKVTGGTFGIPNNRPASGTYKYLLVNKKLVDEYFWDPDDLTTFEDCKDFILDVKKRSSVTPLLSAPEYPGMMYWSEDGSWSILSSSIENGAAYADTIDPRVTLDNYGYRNHYAIVEELKAAGCIAADPSKVTEFGVGVIEGDPSVLEKYEKDYYINVYETPTFTTDDIYGAMFGVTSYTKSLSRSMEIIKTLNTDPELRTILQYGVENKHWRVNENDDTVIDVISKDYKMNLYETGNVYMTYPAAGKPMSDWDYSKQMNLEAKVSPALGLMKSAWYNDDTKAAFKELAAYSKTIKAQFEAIPIAELDDQIYDLIDQIKENETVAGLLADEPAEDATVPSLVKIIADFQSKKKT